MKTMSKEEELKKASDFVQECKEHYLKLKQKFTSMDRNKENRTPVELAWGDAAIEYVEALFEYEALNGR